MKYLHIVSGSNYAVMEPYIEFINDNFKLKEHTFLIMDKYKNIPATIKNHSNIEIIDENSKLKSKELLKYFFDGENIILHGLLLTTSQILMLLLQPEILNKVTWIAWGGDLYQSERKIEGTFSKRAKYLIRNYIQRKIRKKIKRFVGIFPPDIDYYKKKYKSTSKTFYASYVGNLQNPFYKEKMEFQTLEKKIEKNESINIQIGHSSSTILNHIEVFKKIEKYKNEDIKIFLPLSYGDATYGDAVQKKAKEIFGNKAIAIREMMSKDKYMKHLSNIDIAIFNTPRQIGLGNISPLLYMEKKIYIPKGTVMYDFYQSQEIDICDYNKIKNYTFDEFIEPVEMEEGHKYIVDNELNKEKKIQMWSNVFKGIQKEEK